MKRSRIFSLLLCMVLLFSATACSGGGPSSSTPTPASTPASSTAPAPASSEAPAPVKMETIKMWSNDAHSRPIFEEQIALLNNTIAKEKGIIIDYTVYGTDYYSTLDVAVQAGEAPHIFKCNKIPQFAQAGHIVALDDLPGGPEIAAPYAQMNSVGIGIVDGKTYTVPFKVTARGLAYNKDLFASLNLPYPETWEEMRTAAKLITDSGNGQTYGYGIALAYVSYVENFVDPMAARSTGISYYDSGKGEYNFSSLEPYMNHMLDMIKDGSMFPGFETMDDDTKRAQFAAGNIGMIPVFSPDVGVLTTQFPTTFEWGVGPYPTETKDKQFKMPSGPSNFYVVNSSVVKEGLEAKAVEVVGMILSDDFLLKLFDGQADLITRGDVIAKSTATGVAEQWKQFGDTSYRYTAFGMPSNQLAIEGDTFKAVFDKILTGIVTPAEGLADLDNRYNAALQKAASDGTIILDDYKVKDYATVVAMK